MKKLIGLCLLLLALASQVHAADDDADAKRLKKLNDTRAWLTNEFSPWLTNTFPTITFEHWPDWLVNPPSRTRLPTWLTNTFPEIESEDFPYWLDRPIEDQLAKGIPDFWNDVKTKVRTVPQAKNLPVITRGPYLQLGTTNSMVVRWRTAQPRPSVVKYGRSPDRLSREAKASGTLAEHVVLFTNLQPDTKYFYSIGERDTPILVWLTNDIARMSTTNGTLYVSSRSTNLEIAAVTNGALLFSHKRGQLSVATEDGKFKRDTTNRTLLVSTLTSLINLSVSNNALLVASTDHIIPMDGGEVGRRAKKPTRHFAVGTTNVTFVGADSNTFFVTHPPIGPAKPTRIWVLGDPGTRKKEQFKVRDAYYEWNGDRSTDLWIMLGDNAYSAGKDDEYQGGVFNVYQAMLRKSVLWPCLGNHDAGSASSATQSGVYYDIFTLPTQAQAGGVMSGTEAYYSFDYANIHFVVLDSADSDWNENGLMVRWLKADLENNQQEWLVAYSHHPPYSKGSHDSDRDKDSDARMRKMREIVLPMLENHGLDLMMVGHSHAYERSFLLDGQYGHSTNINERVHFKSAKDGRADGTGIYTKPSRKLGAREGSVYVVAGSSGQVSGGKLQHPAMCISLNVLGSLVLDIDGSRLDATFIDEKAVVRDYFTIQKGAGK
jgi:hypothetical protein